MTNSRTDRRRLTVEPLEGRDVPATFGVPWSDPAHLTISFAPDGTSAAGLTSGLAAALDARMPTAVWRATVLRAAQAWAAAADLNVGVVTDSGDPFGTPGATQADGRFGDIRIGGFPMAGDALGEAVPPDPVLAGTLAGDVFFNTSVAFTPQKLYSVALHEIGHALGMAPSTNRQSVMFNRFAGHTALAPADVLAIRALYARRTADPAEGPLGNGTFARSTRIEVPDRYEGKTPLVAYGTLGTRTDTDGFVFQNLSDYAGPVTVRLQTAGISLVPPRLSVFDGAHRLLGRVSAAGTEGDAVEFAIPQTAPGQAYYLRVEAAPGAANRLGRYGLAVTLNDRVEPVGIPVAAVLRGPYDALTPHDLEDLFEHPDRAYYREDGGADDTAAGADDLPASFGPLSLARYGSTASLYPLGDVDYFRVQAPAAGRGVSLALVATARAIGPNGVTPHIEVLDADQNPVPVEVLVNGPGDYTVQATGVAPGQTYFLRAAGAGSGNFALDAAFRSKAVALATFGAGSVDAAHSATYKLYAARTQLFGLTLSADGPAGAAVRMVIADASGATVLDLTAAAGQTVSGLSAFLAPGEYTVTVTSVGTADPVGYRIRGAVQTDPIGPQPSGSQLAPTYPNPTNPNQFLYPGNIVSPDPYLWLFLI
jgi:predicted Zn-dependent protease